MATISVNEFLKGGKVSLVQSAITNPGLQQKGFVSRVGEDLKSRITNIAGTLGEQARGEINPAETRIRVVGQAAAGVGDVLAQGIISATPEKVKAVGLDLLQTKAGQAGISAIKKGLDIYNEWATKNPRIAKDLEGVLNIASILPVGKGGQMAGKGAVSIAGKTALAGEKVATKLTGVTKNIAEKLPQYSEKVAQVLASEPSQQFKTILQETPTNKFDEFIKLAEKSSIDPREPSVFEKVGENLTNATKQIKSQTDSIGKQKSLIINKAKIGLAEFKDAPRKAIIEVSKLEDSPIKDKIITKLKSIKTKKDADKVIDDIQNIIYEAKGTSLIAQGSATEKQLKGIIGRLNEALKDSLPISYRNLNTKYSNRIKVLQTLNRALGEVVEGVPTRGSSLIKQFFSPAGTKTKELFEFIKKNTGVDLAQDAVLAKFAGNLFDDPKVKSLLEGLPTTKAGLVDKTIDFAIEKTGVGEKVGQAIKKGTIKKARLLTK